MWNYLKNKAKQAHSWAQNKIIKPTAKAVAPAVRTITNAVKSIPIVKRATSTYNAAKNVAKVINKTATNYRPPQVPQSQINTQKAKTLASAFQRKITTKTLLDTTKKFVSASRVGRTATNIWNTANSPKTKESIISNWKKTSSLVGKTKAGQWADDTFFRPGREINQKHYDATRLEKQNEVLAKIWEKRETQVTSEINQKLKDRDSGKISPEQYNAWATTVQEEWDKNVNRDIKSLTDKEKEILTEVKLNKTSKVINTGLNWLTKNPLSKFAGQVGKYSIGEGDRNWGSLATNSKRAWLTLKNLINPNEQKYYNSDTQESVLADFQSKNNGEPKEGLSWNQGQSQNPFDRLRNAWQSTFQQRAANPRDFRSDGAADAFEFIADPAWVIPAGATEKMFSKLSSATSKSATISSLKSVWKNDKQPLSKFVKWLGQNAPTQSEKLQMTLQKMSKGKKFDNLPVNEQKLVRDLIGSGVDLTGKNVDTILDIVKSKNKMYKSLLKTENASGIKRTSRAGYFGKQTSDRLAKEKILGNIDASKWRSSGDSIHTTKLSFADAEATRVYVHLRDTGQLVDGHNKTEVLKKLYDQTLDSIKGLSDKDVIEVQRIMLNRNLTKTLSKGFGKGAKDIKLRKFLSPIIEKAGKEVNKAKFINKLKGIPSLPTRLWKKSVLQYRPSWYINNASWNLPASMMAGGKDTLKSYGRLIKHSLKEKTLSPRIIENMPEEVVGSGLYNQFGRKGKRAFGEKVENFSRAAAYDALVKKGVSASGAAKRVNKYLFDYKTTKNWERPLKTIFPFWNWSKNITRLTAQLPLDNAKATKIFREIKNQFMDKPLSQIPDKEMSFTDPKSGQEIKYNPRDGYKGKIKIPGKGWRTIPFLPIMPEQLDEIGLSPWIRLSSEYFSGKDAFGQSFLGKDTVGGRLATSIPQASIVKSFKGMMAQKTGSKTGEKFWISESGYSKSKQGYDSSKPNYDKNIDKTEKYKREIRNFAVAGWGNYKDDFDPKKFKDTESYRSFSKEYFSHDWDKEYTKSQFNEKQSAKEAIAKKYGYDLNKDIYQGKWRKYDTPDTLAKKTAKEAMIKKRTEIYAEYAKIPSGTGERTKFIKKWKDFIVNDPELLKKFPKLDIFPNTPYKNVQPKAKSAKKIFWEKYWAASKEARKVMMANNPQYKKVFKDFVLSPNSPNPKVRMAWAFDNLDPVKRKKWFAEQGFIAPTNNLTWDQKDEISAKKKSDDLASNPVLRATQSGYSKKIKKTIRGKKVKRSPRISWGKKIPIDTMAWRVR